MTLNERAWTYRNKPWWPEGLIQADYGTGPGVHRSWWYEGVRYPDKAAHALIGWGAMVWLADEWHEPRLYNFVGASQGYAIIRRSRTNGRDIHAQEQPAPLAAVLNAIDAVKEAE